MNKHAEYWSYRTVKYADGGAVDTDQNNNNLRDA